ncbi:MAG: prolyl oligopeptidase family serine peptidase [Deltaproteobacteria bacterium]|nr:prolyl oligopeptidase family serine peptidase [Deltaproteobacteria bacterium]
MPIPCPCKGLVIALWLFIIPASSLATSADTNGHTAGHGNDELQLGPGKGGFVSAWLRLGPFAAPDSINRTEGALANWSPVESLSLSQVKLGAIVSHKRVELLLSDSERIGLKPQTGAITYLVGVIRTATAKRIYLSSASTDGIEVSLNGTRQFANGTHKRWVRKDVNLTPLSLQVGDNLLVIRLFKAQPGRWSTWLRFMDEDFQRADIVFVLPGALSRLAETIQSSARLKLTRRVAPYTGTVEMDCWLEFTGAKPMLPLIDGWKWSTDIGVKPNQPHPTDLVHPRKAQYLLHRFEGIETLPGNIQLAFNGASFSAKSLIRVSQAERLFNAAKRFAQIDRPSFPQSSIESVEWRINHLSSLMQKGDTGYDYISRELTDTLKMVESLEKGSDPYADKRNQLQRRGYRSKVDGALHEYALYVPPGWKESGNNRYSMIVSLHGLGGHPIKTLSVLFGNPMGEEETREERIRFPGPIGPAPMFVLAPEGFGSSGYYALGERDVLDVIDIVKKRYRIDENRIYITGASMGGTGAARLALHYPDLFAAAVPLCGYHNMRYYSQVRNQPISDVENYLLDVHSNIHWVENGTHIPMYIVHGTKDQPRSSQDLLEFHKLAGNEGTLTLLDAGHNVWDDTYKNSWIFRHFVKYHRNPAPRHIRFKTANLRYNKSDWLRIDAMTQPNDWAKIDAHWREDGTIVVSTENIHAFTVLKMDAPLSDNIAAIVIDNRPVPDIQNTNGPLTFVKTTDGWQAQSFSPPRMTKKAGVFGPIGDAEYDSLLFVYGTGDPWEGTLAKRIIGHLKTPRYGMTVQWKVKADVEVTEKDIQKYSIVIVGTPSGNRLLQRIQSQLPIRVESGAVVAGNHRFVGERTAAAFIYPNPLNPDRYVVIHTGVSREAIYFSGHLPTMIPDYVIFDASDWGYTEGHILGENRDVFLSGFFDRQWQLNQ